MRPTKTVNAKSQSGCRQGGRAGCGKEGHLAGFNSDFLSWSLQSSYMHVAVVTPLYVNDGTARSAVASKREECGSDSQPEAFLFGVCMIQQCLCGFTVCMRV